MTVLGRVSDAEKRAALERADVLAAPSLGGESFGMVLTEGFAAGTPVVASDIPGYRDVVRDGVDGLLVPRGDATALAETLRDLALAAGAHGGARRGRGRAAPSATRGRRSPRRSPPPTRTRAPCRSPRAPPSAPRCGSACAPPTSARAVPRGGCPRWRPAPSAAWRTGVLLRRGAIALAALGAAGGSYLALERIGVDRVAHTLVTSSPSWVVIGLALMCVSMIFRAVSWHAILKAALPGRRARASPTPGRARPSAC